MKSAIHIPHHGAAFAPTVWTNVYFPNLFLVFGDIISGPVSGLFGPGVLDVEVPIGGPTFRHTHYWSQPRTEPAPFWIGALRRAVNLRGHVDEVLWDEKSSG